MKYVGRIFLLALPLVLLAFSACRSEDEPAPALLGDGYVHFIWNVEDNIEISLSTTQTDYQETLELLNLEYTGTFNRHRFDFDGRIPEGRYTFTVRCTADPAEFVLVEANIADGGGWDVGSLLFSEIIPSDNDEATFTLIVEGKTIRYEG